VKTSQAVIILLLVANLAATIWFGVEKRNRPEPIQGTASSSHSLPALITDDVKEQILEEFKRLFNEGNFDGLYSMFGAAAQARFSKEASDQEFEKLKKFFHSVEDGGFSHSEFLGAQGDTNVYVLNYVVKLAETSEFGTKGTLKVTLAVHGDQYEIYGIRLNGGTI